MSAKDEYGTNFGESRLQSESEVSWTLCCFRWNALAKDIPHSCMRSQIVKLFHLEINLLFRPRVCNVKDLMIFRKVIWNFFTSKKKKNSFTVFSDAKSKNFNLIFLNFVKYSSMVEVGTTFSGSCKKTISIQKQLILSYKQLHMQFMSIGPFGHTYNSSPHTCTPSIFIVF